LGLCIDNTEINFSKNYEVTYDSKHRDLKIKEKKNPNKIHIYGDNIQDINVLVGKNGIGKSTIMRLLGLPEKDRSQYYSFLKEKEEGNLQELTITKWFAIYHLYGDNFAIEGDWNLLLKNHIIDNLKVKPINKLNDSHFNKDNLFYIYFQNNTGVNWFSEYVPEDKNDHFRLDYFHRISCNVSNYNSVTKYLIDSYCDNDFSTRMGSKPGTKVEIQLAHIIDQIHEKSRLYNKNKGNLRKEVIDLIGRNIYGDEGEVIRSVYNSQIHRYNEEYSIQQRFIISYLETVAHFCLYGFHLTEKVNEYVKNNPYVQIYGGEDTYNHRKKYLFEVIENTNIDMLNYRAIASDTVEKLERIPSKYFLSSVTISVPISKLKNDKKDGRNALYELMQDLDVDRTFDLRQLSILKVTFSNMSSGEAHFIDIFASIHGALQTRKRMIANTANPGEQTCILLLDEPDMSFHPEWSRTFIDNLTHFLNNSYKDINFQVIITTHSPLMLSDIQSDSIYCLGKDDEGNLTVSNPKYGLLSGINDILIDGFFTESLFGKFAENFANGIVTRLNELEENIDKWQIDQDDFDKEYKDLSKRIDILGGGLIKDSLMQRLTMAKKWFYMRNGYDQD
jgi:ABC-type transporter Mla maintaining outer membrane lipid asymmetry ATPase subunit MlaF